MPSAKDLIAIQPIATGEVDRLRYQLFDKPASEHRENEGFSDASSTSE